MAPKKAALVDASNELVNAAVPDAPPAKAAGKQTVEQKYQKLTHLEHILKRPDTYVGSLEMVTTEMFVVDKESQRMDHRKITYVPGLYKIFDEIVVNAADNKQRDASMTEMRINIDRETNRISVYNNGKGIPVVIHQEHNVWVPELIFGACPQRRRPRASAAPRTTAAVCARSAAQPGPRCSAPVQLSCIVPQATCSRAATSTTTKRRRQAAATATAPSCATSSRPSSAWRRRTRRWASSTSSTSATTCRRRRRPRFRTIRRRKTGRVSRGSPT